MVSFFMGLLWMLLQCLAFLAARLGMLLLWLLWPVWLIGGALAFLSATAQSAEAGWFSWLWGGGDQTKIHSLEAANRALQSAAEVVNEAAKHQADQNVQVLEAIQALSSERTELASHLGQLSAMALRDSQWAAALNVAGPVLVVVGVLVVIALALWLTHKSEAGDIDVVDALLISQLSHGPNESAAEQLVLGPAGGSGATRRLPHRGPEQDPAPDSDIYAQTQEPEQEV